MNIQKYLSKIPSGVTLLLISQVSLASPVSWTNWTTNSTPSEVSGTLTIGSHTVGVTFSGEYSFVQVDGGTNYYQPSEPYVSSQADNAPPDSDIIALDNAGTSTITFSETVQNPVLALVSWNGNTVDFGVPIEVLSYGDGYWGNGTPIVNATGTGFYGDGDVHTVIRLKGSYKTITFTHTSEYWHGLTVGAASVVNTVDVGGLVNGMKGTKVVCKNLTTKQGIIFSLPKTTSWSCQSKGLTVRSKDKIQQTVTGIAD